LLGFFSCFWGCITVKALADHTNVNTTLKYYAAVNMKKIGDEINTKGIYRDIFRDNKRLMG
jgi:hypothetical protein